MNSCDIWNQHTEILHFYLLIISIQFIHLKKKEGGFSDSSVVKKKSTCNAGDPSLISGSGRSAGEGRG